MERRYIEEEESTMEREEESVYHIIDRETGDMYSECGDQLVETHYGQVLKISPEESGRGTICEKCKNCLDTRAS